MIFSFFLPGDPRLMSIVPAFLYACLVVTAVLFVLASPSKTPERTPYPRLTGALFTGITLGAIPPPLLSYVGGDLLTGPNHICTLLYLLFLLWLRAYDPDTDPSLSKSGVFRNVFHGIQPISVILWSLLLIGDPFSVTIGVLPFLCVDFLLAWLERGTWSRFRRTLFTILLAVLFAKLFSVLTLLIGFHLAWKINTDFISLQDLPGHVGDVVKGLLDAYGGNVFGHSLVVADTWVRLLRALLLGATLVLSVRMFLNASSSGSRGRSEKLESLPLLISAIVLLDLLAVLASQNAHNNGTVGVDRFLLPVAIFGTILLGNSFRDFLGSPGGDRIGKVFVGGVAALGMIGAVAECLGGWGMELVAFRENPSVPGVFRNILVNDQAKVAAWLEEHGLQSGYAQYWNAQIVSVMTRGVVTVAPVKFSSGSFRPNPIFISSNTYLKMQEKRPVFLITGAAGVNGVSREKVLQVFGNPDEDQEIGRYHVLVWRKGIKLSLSSP